MAETVGRPQPDGEPHPPGVEPDPPAGEWRLSPPADTDAGLHAESTGGGSGLVHVGESWAGDPKEIAWHEHPSWEFYLQLHGGSSWDVGRGVVHLAPGWLLAVPPGTAHRGRPRRRAEPGRHHFAYAAVDVAAVDRHLPGVGGVWEGKGVLWSPQGRELAPVLRRLMAEVAEPRPLRRPALVAAVALLLVEAARALLPEAGDGSRHVRHVEVDRARRLLDEEFATLWSVDTLAEACGTSRTRLAQLFTTEVGQPPYRYLLERRVERAAELLATTPYPVAEVAAMVGFSSHVHLARMFRQVHGMSPTQWRRSARASPPSRRYRV